MKQFCMDSVGTVRTIGTVRVTEGRTVIEVEKKYIPALQGLEGFSHLAVLWWFSEFDTEEARSVFLYRRQSTGQNYSSLSKSDGSPNIFERHYQTKITPRKMSTAEQLCRLVQNLVLFLSEHQQSTFLTTN
jgi:hypothetical protein